MRVNTKSGWFKLSIVLVSIVFVYVSCNFRPIFLKPKFSVWQPKQLDYAGELVKKWSFDFTSKTEVLGYVRKDNWMIAAGNSVFKINENGLEKDFTGRFYGVDDSDSSARIEYHHGTMGYFDNSLNLIPYWFRFGASEMLVAKDGYIVMLRGDSNVLKIDINSGALLWQYSFPEKDGFLEPTFCVAGNKVALNACFKNVGNTSNETDVEKVVLLDIDTGMSKMIDIPGNCVCTQFDNKLYLIMENNRISRFDTEKMELVGETLVIDKDFKDGHYIRPPFLHWFKASNQLQEADALINPMTMKLAYKGAKIKTSSQYLYSNYLVCYAVYNDHISGIDTDTFEETWRIPTKDFAEGFKVVLGDDRGILIHDGDKLICFNRP